MLSLLFNAPLEAAGERDASAQPGQGALVLPGTPGDGELLRFLGRHRNSRPHGGSAAAGALTSTARTKGVGRWFARERLLANTIFLTLVVLNVIFIVIGTFFRGPNWALCLSVLRRTDDMRLALAIASFVVLIVHGVVFYDQFFHTLGEAPDGLLRPGAPLSKIAERAELEARSPRSSRPSSPASAIRAWTAAPPATSRPTIRVLRTTPSR